MKMIFASQCCHGHALSSIAHLVCRPDDWRVVTTRSTRDRRVLGELTIS